MMTYDYLEDGPYGIKYSMLHIFVQKLDEFWNEDGDAIPVGNGMLLHAQVGDRIKLSGMDFAWVIHSREFSEWRSGETLMSRQLELTIRKE